MAQKLIEKAYKNVYALKGGWDGWVEAKYPLEKRAQEAAEDTEKEDEQAQENEQKSSEKKK